MKAALLFSSSRFSLSLSLSLSLSCSALISCSNFESCASCDVQRVCVCVRERERAKCLLFRYSTVLCCALLISVCTVLRVKFLCQWLYYKHYYVSRQETQLTSLESGTCFLKVFMNSLISGIENFLNSCTHRL